MKISGERKRRGKLFIWLFKYHGENETIAKIKEKRFSSFFRVERNGRNILSRIGRERTSYFREFEYFGRFDFCTFEFTFLFLFLLNRSCFYCFLFFDWNPRFNRTLLWSPWFNSFSVRDTEVPFSIRKRSWTKWQKYLGYVWWNFVEHRIRIHVIFLRIWIFRTFWHLHILSFFFLIKNIKFHFSFFFASRFDCGLLRSPRFNLSTIYFRDTSSRRCHSRFANGVEQNGKNI